jgi:hypothetical protein
MLTEVGNKVTMFGHATSTLPALPGGQEHEEFVLIHSAWAGWYYEISSNEAAASS